MQAMAPKHKFSKEKVIEAARRANLFSWFAMHSLSALIVAGDCPSPDREIGQILTSFSICKSIRDPPALLPEVQIYLHDPSQ